MKLRVWSAVAGALLLALGTAALPAYGESSFTGWSSATGVDVTLANNDFPLIPAVQAAGPSVGTSLDSTGQGTAFASAPYPGTTVAELPATAGGLSGLPIPDYPFFVSSTSDDEPAQHAQPGLELHATCRGGGAAGCSASTLAGAAPATTRVRASVLQPSADHVVATARADTDGLSIPGDVTLSDAHTSATVVLENGRLRRQSTLSVARLTIGGTSAFSIDDGKVTVAGTEVPVPFSSVVTALRSAGVEADLFAASASKYGVVAPVLRLRTVLPPAPAVLGKPSTVVYTLGGAEASIAPGAYRADGPPRGGLDDDQPAGPATVAAPAGEAGFSPPPGAPTTPTYAGSAPLPDAVAAVPGGAVPTVPTAQAAQASLPAQSFDLSDSYLALVLCGVVWFGATQALRIFGVRFRWTS